MFEILKSKSKLIITGVIILVITLLSARIFFLKKDVSSLKNKVEEKNDTIEELNSNIEYLKDIVTKITNQKKIEDDIIYQQQEEEQCIDKKKNENISELNDLVETNNDVKDWCEQPLPADISTLIMLGLR